MNDNILTLKQIQKKLQTKQHVLIHLCEKGVIEPDFQQTEGRGVHREFSQRNLFEFALALIIRKYGIPVTTTAAIIRLLKSFERSVQRSVKGFHLLDYLKDDSQKMDITLQLYDGEYMVFGLKKGEKLMSATGFDLKNIIMETIKPLKLDKLNALPTEFDSFLKLDLKRIAKRAV